MAPTVAMAENPTLLVTCCECGHLHEPERPLDLNAICLGCADPNARERGARAGDYSPAQRPNET